MLWASHCYDIAKVKLVNGRLQTIPNLLLCILLESVRKRVIYSRAHSYETSVERYNDNSHPWPSTVYHTRWYVDFLGGKHHVVQHLTYVVSQGNVKSASQENWRRYTKRLSDFLAIGKYIIIMQMLLNLTWHQHSRHISTSSLRTSEDPL